MNEYSFYLKLLSLRKIRKNFLQLEFLIFWKNLLWYLTSYSFMKDIRRISHILEDFVHFRKHIQILQIKYFKWFQFQFKPVYKICVYLPIKGLREVFPYFYLSYFFQNRNFTDNKKLQNILSFILVEHISTFIWVSSVFHLRNLCKVQI